MENKKVLIITYYWPPSGGPGVQRWLKFAKYLPEFGIEPIVICPDPEKAEYPIRDESLYADVSKDIDVHTTDNKSFYSTYKKFTKAKTAPYSGFANDANPNLKQKISRFVRGNFFLPDSRKGWNKYAFAKACELIEKYNIKTVITTSPPHSTQLVGLNLKAKYDIHWVADLRDPWTDIYYYNNFYPTSLAKNIDKRYELKVLEKADIVISVSEFIKRQFIEKSKLIDAEKIKVIPNGYDEEDFSFKTEREDKTFTITYTGTLAANYDILTIISFLKSCDKEYKLRFVGKVDANIENKLKEELKDKVEFKGFVPHSQSIEYLKKTDILLLVIPVIKDNEGILTGKLFEYIGSGKPILCLGPTHGDAAVIIDKAEAGKTFNYDDTKGVSDFITGQIEKASSEENTNEKIKLFSRRTLTEDLTKILRCR